MMRRRKGAGAGEMEDNVGRGDAEKYHQQNRGYPADRSAAVHIVARKREKKSAMGLR